MEEKRLFLANGDLLIRSEEGGYFISHYGEGLPVLIEEEEGERLLFDTANQLIQTVETLSESIHVITNITDIYEKALEEINETAVYYDLKGWALNGEKIGKIATKALEVSEEQ